jgi:hypothetical protein
MFPRGAPELLVAAQSAWSHPVNQPATSSNRSVLAGFRQSRRNVHTISQFKRKA